MENETPKMDVTNFLPSLSRHLSAEIESTLRNRIGEIPCMQNLQMTIEGFGVGECILRMKHNPSFDGIFKSFHGGLLTTAADTVACFAILSQTGPDQMLTTTDLNIRFLSACLTDVLAHARIIKLGRTLCPVAVDLYDTEGKRVAIAQVTYMLLDQIPKR